MTLWQDHPAAGDVLDEYLDAVDRAKEHVLADGRVSLPPDVESAQVIGVYTPPVRTYVLYACGT